MNFLKEIEILILKLFLYQPTILNNRAKSPLPTGRHEDEEENGRKLRFPSSSGMMNRPLPNNNRRNSFNSESSENTYASSGSTRQQQYDQSSIKSPLMGSRERPRGKSPLAGYLGRK